ncbi:MAG: hydroxyacid dehydrogenase [Firmicutes bacterium]|nr:hydroxyacid dehydrogenase [Bacillota bacterium]
MKTYIAIPNGREKEIFITPKIRARIEKLGEVGENKTSQQITANDVGTIAKEYDAIIVSWGAPCIKKSDLMSKKLKFIGHIGGSVQDVVSEDVFDIDINVVSGNRGFAKPLAESTLLLMLMGLKRWHVFDSMQKSGVEIENNERPLTDSLIGKCVGLLGFGQISREVISLIKPFDVRIMVADDYITSDEANKLGVEISNVDEICEICDVISIHHTLNESTLHLLNERRINKMKSTALIVNTARGKIIDQNALLKRLEKGELFAALDVYETPTLAVDHPLRKLDNTILTPHLGGKTMYCHQRLVEIVIEQLELFAKGMPLTGRITKDIYCRMTKKF